MSYENRGQCHYCGELNAYTELACSRCSTELPWAHALAQNALAQSRQVMPTSITQPVPPAQPISQWTPSSPSQLGAQSVMSAPMGQAVGQPLMAGQPRFCAHCGSQHAMGAAFCAQCGTPTQVLVQVAPQVSMTEASQRKRTWGLPFKTAAAPATINAATPTVAAPTYIMPQQMAHLMSQQPAINVSVVTTQNANPTTHGSGWWGRLMLFCFKASMVFAFLFGLWLAIISR